jgi:Tol biopolymer transport system component
VATVREDEGHLSDIAQVTHGGDNGVARWSWASDALLLRTRKSPKACGRIVEVHPFADHPPRSAVAGGEAAAFLPGDHDVVYAASSTCGKDKDEARAPKDAKDAILLDPDVDVFAAAADGSSPRKLTDSPAFDGEPNVCGKDGSIVFTSMRDGDPDLYRMNADGSNVRRLTAMPGYDGQASFDGDCTHVLWRASRPRPSEAEDYKQLLARNLVPAGPSELWIANADGTEAREVTYLDAPSFSPTWLGTEGRIVFASGWSAAGPHEVDLWAVDANGTNLERITTAPGPDGSPAMSPDGKWIAFTSRRAALPLEHDVDVMVARWSGAWRHVEVRPADHVMGDAAWLADPAREGRGLGTKGLEASGAYVERSFKSFGVLPAGDEDYRQTFDVIQSVSGVATLAPVGAPVDAGSVRPLGFSSSATVLAPLVYVAGDEDFGRVDVKGKIAVVRAAAHASLRHEAWLAHDRGATGLVAIAEGTLSDPVPESDEGIPAALVANAAVGPLLAGLVRGQHPTAKLSVTLTPKTIEGFNVVGRWPATVPSAQRLPGVVVVGAHYDHIGFGAGKQPDTSPGADDNASGTAVLLQIARSLSEEKPTLRRDIILVAFSGEEERAAGAQAFVRHLPEGVFAKDVAGAGQGPRDSNKMMAMINLDMVGRMRDDTLQVFGADTAAQWPDLLAGACDAARINCARASGGGFGATDHTPFQEAGVPVLHLFTGVHGDYGKPTDTVDRLNAAGMAQVAIAAENLARDMTDIQRLDVQRVAAPIEGVGREPANPGGGATSGTTLGTYPDPKGPPKGQTGMLLSGVRPGGPADKAGLRGGDLIVRIGGHVVGGVEDVMFVLTGAKPGQHIKVVALREPRGQEITADVVLEETRVH